MTETTLPDNLKSRTTRLYVAERTFTGDDGKDVKFKRFVAEGLINGQTVEIEFKIDKKDALLLSLFEVVENVNLSEE